MAEDMKKLISTKETEVTSAIGATHNQLAEVKDKLEALQLATQDKSKTEGNYRLGKANIAGTARSSAPTIFDDSFLPRPRFRQPGRHRGSDPPAMF